MKSVHQEINKICENHSIALSETITNRYIIHTQNSSKIKTAYCFSVPIRNMKTNNVVDLRFYHNKQGSVFIGSEAKISIADKIRFSNQYGQCEIAFQGDLWKKTDEAIFFTNQRSLVEIHPTLNGLVFLFDCIPLSKPPQILLHLTQSFKSIRYNNKYFSVMREKFVPFITVSCIGAMDSTGQISAPCEVYHQQINDFDYILTLCPVDKSNRRIAIEINMQETKLFQDTTVESKNPNVNNAFGGISFLGTSKPFGEQWLYSRLEVSHIAQLQGKKTIKSILHIPQLGISQTPIVVNNISERFCSFGSNWKNKIAITDTVTVSSFSNGYHHLDMTSLFGNFRKKSINFVLRDSKTNRPVIIPTGDSFYAPQILEVKYQ